MPWNDCTGERRRRSNGWRGLADHAQLRARRRPAPRLRELHGRERRGIDRCSAARRAGDGDGAAGGAARRDAAMGVVGSTAALLRGEQAAAMELPVMQLDTTRPWASRDRPPLYCEASRRGDGAAGDAARHVAAVGVKDRPPLCCEASRRRRWGCRRCCSTRRGHGRRGIDRCSGARRARGGDGAAGAAARRDATMGVVGSTAALLQSEQTAATELLVMRLDATRPWASWDRPPLWREAGRRRRWSCR
jgi:hypothetical protein